ncbi:carboxylesterase/lipase family protein [Salinibacillus xinjiangensis]|uniref:Carboxylic ester hydrolase n=1 Tax=Salinibacillus xinjiangensis TaxID=1229268 RepID=A0A6G1X9U4_9BACI|nr:carboxylesterase/lipase family protein [Salinibacillus xinjiangensis]MRG87783.1 carboxylesterase family protein [Salinibacillus xinjiangensis]
MANTIIETAYGKVEGEEANGIYAWKGIPYAKPPVGHLRFQPPEKPNRWEGIRDATKFGPVASQPVREVMQFLGNEMDKVSEDCLSLNIWSRGKGEKKRPVMVWIHGGAFLSGSGSSSWYNGATFVERDDVVVVTLNYRLGIMGFLHLGEIGGEEYTTSGNCGLLDQIAALEWVQENIEAFGGDPNRVTVFGESAGAMSIGALLAMPAAKGLFQQAILQSGAANNVLSTAKATEVANKMLSALNVEPNQLSKLYDIPIEDLLEASELVPMMSLGPVVDGVSIPKHPSEALAEGAAKDIPVLIGTNKDEWRLFSFFEPMWKDPDESTKQAIFQQTFRDSWPKLAEKFVDEREGLTHGLYDRLMTMQVFSEPAIRLAESQLKHDTPIWMYRFDWQSPVFNGGLQACHALELPFVWNTLDYAEHLTGDGPERQRVADQMQAAWISFVKNGEPRAEGMPEWPAYDTDKRKTMLIHTESKVESDPHGDDRVKWTEVMTALNQGANL